MLNQSETRRSFSIRIGEIAVHEFHLSVSHYGDSVGNNIGIPSALLHTPRHTCIMYEVQSWNSRISDIAAELSAAPIQFCTIVRPKPKYQGGGRGQGDLSSWDQLGTDCS